MGGDDKVVALRLIGAETNQRCAGLSLVQCKTLDVRRTLFDRKLHLICKSVRRIGLDYGVRCMPVQNPPAHGRDA